MEHVVLTPEQAQVVARELLAQAAQLGDGDRIWVSQGIRHGLLVQASVSRKSDPRVLDLQPPLRVG